MGTLLGSAHLRRVTKEALMSVVTRILREQIELRGSIPFAEFMERALYDPAGGYYRREQPIGRRGDFFTSVSVGPFFGELLSLQFARWIEKLPKPGKAWQIVEGGAHDGQLARDILEALRNREPSIFASLEYWIVEPFEERRLAQQDALRSFANVQWCESFLEMPAPVHGVIFSNELLDAMPVHPFAWNVKNRCWEEKGVTMGNGSFVWSSLRSATISQPSIPDALLNVLPDGYVVESSPAAIQWWLDAASVLAAGNLMTIDYGGVFEELLSPGRSAGTLRAYSGHRVSDEVLINPGEQDITAHVNFSELQRAGATSGLETQTFTTQSQFLTKIARDLWARSGSWSHTQVRQFQTLVHPEHLGRPFRVLVQSRQQAS